MPLIAVKITASIPYQGDNEVPIDTSIYITFDSLVNDVDITGTDGSLGTLNVFVGDEVTGESIPYHIVSNDGTNMEIKTDEFLPYDSLITVRLDLKRGSPNNVDWPVWGKEYNRSFFNDWETVPIITTSGIFKEVITLGEDEYFTNSRLMQDYIVAFGYVKDVLGLEVPTFKMMLIRIEDDVPISTRIEKDDLPIVDMILTTGYSYYLQGNVTKQVNKVGLEELGDTLGWEIYPLSSSSKSLYLTDDYLYVLTLGNVLLDETLISVINGVQILNKNSGEILSSNTFAFQETPRISNDGLDYIYWSLPSTERESVVMHWCNDSSIIPVLQDTRMTKHSMFNLGDGTPVWTLNGGEGEIKEGDPITTMFGNEIKTYTVDGKSQTVYQPLACNGTDLVVGLSNTLVDTVEVPITGFTDWVTNHFGPYPEPKYGFNSDVTGGFGWDGTVGTFWGISDMSDKKASLDVLFAAGGSGDEDMTIDVIVTKSASLCRLDRETGVLIDSACPFESETYDPDYLPQEYLQVGPINDISEVRLRTYNHSVGDKQHGGPLDGAWLLEVPGTAQEMFGLDSGEYVYAGGYFWIYWTPTGGTYWISYFAEWNAEIASGPPIVPITKVFESQMFEGWYGECWCWALTYKLGAIAIEGEAYLPNFSTNNIVITADKIIFPPREGYPNDRLTALNLLDFSWAWSSNVGNRDATIVSMTAHDDYLFYLLDDGFEIGNGILHILDIRNGSLVKSVDVTHSKDQADTKMPIMTDRNGKVVLSNYVIGDNRSNQLNFCGEE